MDRSRSPSPNGRQEERGRSRSPAPAANEAQPSEPAAATSSSSSAPSTGDASSSSDPRRPRLHISGLPPSWNNAAAHSHFSPYGTIIDVVVFHDSQGRAKYGFLEFATNEQCQAAIDAWDGREIEPATGPASVKYAKPKGSAPGQGAEADPARLFVANIGAGATQDEVRAEFEKYGRLVECSVWQNQRASIRPSGGEPSLAAFVQFAVGADARAARQALHSTNALRGTEPDLAAKDPSFQPTPPLIVDFAKPKTEPGSNRRGRYDDRRGGYGAGGGYGGGRGYDDRRGGYDYARRDDYSRGGYERGYERGYDRGYDRDYRRDDYRRDDPYASSSSRRYDERDYRRDDYDRRDERDYYASSSSSSSRRYDDYDRRDERRSRDRSRSPRRY